MICQNLKINGWAVRIFYSVNSTDNIGRILLKMDCPSVLILQAVENIDSNNYNVGFTYTSYALKESVMVIGETSSFGQILNTITHESYHLTLHLKKYYLWNEEESAIFIGNFIDRISKNINRLFNSI